MNKLVYFILLLLNINAIYSVAMNMDHVAITPTTKSYCSYIEECIFCSGRYNGTEGFKSNVVAIHVQNTSVIPTTNLRTRWHITNIKYAYDMADREGASFFPNIYSKKLFIYGGRTKNNDTLDNPFISLDVMNGVYSTVSITDKKVGEYGQIYYASATYIPGLEKIVFYGGLTQ
ncbi:hypothetical protein BDB01DRAFT_465705 [Pilobolus umbonatus]|nr:hypothetical protein BDB01DRAFT_465705 [Pilobolus umbonatus]